MPIPDSPRNFCVSMTAFLSHIMSLWWVCLIVMAVAAGCSADPSPRPTTQGAIPPAQAGLPTPYPTYTLYPTYTPYQTFTPPAALPETRNTQPTLTILGTRSIIKAKLINVIDGDTFEVQTTDGNRDRVRLLGVDAPETNERNKPNEYDGITDTACLNTWGDQAAEFAVNHLDGRDVTLILEGTTFRELFTFGRLLAFVELEGQDFSAELVRQGLARVYTEIQNSREEGLLQLQQQAQESNAGLWSCRQGSPAPTPTLTPAPTLPEPGPTPTPQLTKTPPTPVPVPTATAAPAPTIVPTPISPATSTPLPPPTATSAPTPMPTLPQRQPSHRFPHQQIHQFLLRPRPLCPRQQQLPLLLRYQAVLDAHQVKYM